MNIGDNVQTVPGIAPYHKGKIVAVNVRAGNDGNATSEHIAIAVEGGSPWLVLPQSALQKVGS